MPSHYLKRIKGANILEVLRIPLGRIHKFVLIKVCRSQNEHILRQSTLHLETSLVV
jgi:hypothetical protein